MKLVNVAVYCGMNLVTVAVRSALGANEHWVAIHQRLQMSNASFKMSMSLQMSTAAAHKEETIILDYEIKLKFINL